jgi:hypothetical protein
MRTRFLLLLLPALAALIATGNVRAWGGKGKAVPPAAASTAPIAARPNSTLPDSVRRVERQTGGEVLRATPMQQDGHEVYRLKVLTRDGRVRVMQADPSQPANDPPADSRKRKPEGGDKEEGASGG